MPSTEPNSRDLYVFMTRDYKGRPKGVVLPVPHAELLPLYMKLLQSEFPVQMSPGKARFTWMMAPPPGLPVRTAFFRAMGRLMTRGLTFVDALPRLILTIKNLPLQHALGSVLAEVLAGASAAEAFRQHPKIFDEGIVGRIEAGETTGGLKDVFSQIAAHEEMISRTRQQAFVQMVYPAITIIVLYLIVSGILYGVIPKLADLFAGLKNLPILTTLLLKASNAVAKQPLLLGTCPAIAIALFLFRSELMPLMLAGLRHMPLVRRHYLTAQISLFTATLSSMLRGGLQLAPALEYAARAQSDRGLRRALESAASMTKEGDRPTVAFQPVVEYFGAVSEDLAAAVSVGEASSTLTDSLEACSISYREDFGRASEVLGKMMEPAITVIVGGVVGTFAFALYYPIMTASQNVG